MSDWKKRNEDWRDEDELEEEEECECPWVDSKGKVRETAYCQYLLEKHPIMCSCSNRFSAVQLNCFDTPRSLIFSVSIILKFISLAPLIIM